MKAVIMAGGSGTRLRPLTQICPKTMMPVVNRPVLGHILNLLKRHHIDEVIVAGFYLAGQIRSWSGNGSRWGVSLHHVLEEEPLGTAGCVKHTQPYLDGETFLVLSGDLVTDLDLSKLVRFHRQKQALATLALTPKAEPFGYGVAKTDGTGRVIAYVEKPAPEQVIAETVNTGIYVLEPEVLDAIAPHVACDFSKDLFPQMLRRQAPLFGYVSEGYWSDIGTIESYRQAITDVLAGKVSHITLGHHLGEQVWAEDNNIELGPEVRLQGPIYLGDEVKIDAGVTITGPTVVSDHTVIGRGAQIEQSIIGRACQLGEQAQVQHSIISRHASLPAGAMISDQIVMAEQEESLLSGTPSSIRPG